MPSNHEYYMSLVLEQARKGLGFTSPNPMVGTVIVKNNQIISKGYHKKDGASHAETNAIDKVKSRDLKGAVLYVNLEPCSHYGRTPPCADAIVTAGIKKVVISAVDPDTRVHGRGINILKKAGIDVITGILEKEAKELNSIYYFFKKNCQPYIVLKSALTLDGRIATSAFNSKWISNEKARMIDHKLRLRLKAIAVGKNTIIQDKPMLNCRIRNYTKKPVDKLIFSNTPIDTKSLAPNEGRVFFIDNKISSSAENFINFCNEKMIDSVLIEGGGIVNTWFLRNNLVDRIFLFYKPGFLGSDAVPVFSGTGIKSISEINEYKITGLEKIENNVMIELSKGEPICLLD
jgi:diaminohydroxyphosphoribosylaminopyrimidine deaminase/5-amino-6-(5-phosphoribosylamino)uracil reductase